MEFEEILKEFEKETGYKAEPYSYSKIYQSGAILKNGLIVEIDGDDHSILEPLPDRLTYRFIERRKELYFRIPKNYSNIQIGILLKIIPEGFEYVAIDIVDENRNVLKSFSKEFAVGNRMMLRMFLDDVLSSIR